jgi:hypothetical protein
MSSTLWSRIGSLRGQTLQTVTGLPFTMVTQDSDAVWVSPGSTGKQRRIRRMRFEQAAALGIPAKNLRPIDLQQGRTGSVADSIGGVNASYIVAMLRAIS